MGVTLATIGNLIKDELDTKIRATIKGAEIAKLGALPRQNVKFHGADFDIEVVSMNAIEGGVEVFARAWDANSQIGFGKDGSVDIERFIIINPPILVPDGTQTLTEDSDGNPRLVNNYKEDLEAALLQSLASTIEVKKERFGSDKIQPLKEGHTTTTVYASSGDGTVRSFNATWATARAGSNLSTYFTAASNFAAGDQFFNGDSNYYVDNGLIPFDTSSIPDSDVISSVTLRTTWTKGSGHIGTTFHWCKGTWATDTPADTDFALYEAVSRGTASNTTNGQKTINGADDGAGFAYISKTGVTKVHLLSDGNFNDSPQSPASADYRGSEVTYSETAGTTDDPQLVAEHAVGDPAPSVTDDVTVSESITMMVDENINVFDSVTVTEAITMMMDLNIDVFDGVTITESVSLEVITPTDPSAIDNITVSEEVSMLIEQLVPSVFDAVTVSESVSLAIEAFKEGLVRLRSTEQSYPLMMDDDENR